MPGPRRYASYKVIKPSRVQRQADHDFLEVQSGDHRLTTAPSEQMNSPRRRETRWPPVPDLFDVITYSRACGDSFTIIASIGFWVGEDPKKALNGA
jgi:hypothetical protein